MNRDRDVCFARPLRRPAAIAGTSVVASILFLACGGQATDSTLGTTTEAVTGSDAGSITISGVVADANSPQAGITITLSGTSQAKVVTDFSGSYSFVVKPGSYSLTAQGTANFFEAPFESCLALTPSIVNLNNLTASTTVNFLGTGTNGVTNCAPAEAIGAMSGALTVSGVVTSGGLPVPGVLVSMNGSTQAFRVSDETGAYTFSVNSGGSYTLSLSGACSSFAPGVVNLNKIKTNQTENFVGTQCPPAPLSLCPTIDSAFGFTEPASCTTVTTQGCGFDRVLSWETTIQNDWFNINAADCRFGQWNNPPIVNLFTLPGLQQDSVALNLFALQLFGCALAGNLVGPLPFPLVLTDLESLTFTTADLAALSQEFVQAISQGLSDQGAPALTSAQITAINAQLASAAGRVKGVKSSSSLSFSTCPVDAGAQ